MEQLNTNTLRSGKKFLKQSRMKENANEQEGQQTKDLKQDKASIEFNKSPKAI